VAGTSLAVPVVPDVVKIKAMESKLGCGAKPAAMCLISARCSTVRPAALAGTGVSRTCRNATLDREPTARDASSTLVVESNDALGRAAHVRHDEADAGIKFSGMPLDLGDNPPRRGPGSGLIAEIGMEPAHMVRRSSDWAREQIADPALQNLVGR
jgi:hypothetical protein